MVSYGMLPAQQVPAAAGDSLSAKDEIPAELPLSRNDSLPAGDAMDTVSLTGDTTHVPAIRRIEIYLDYLKLVSFALPAELKSEIGLAIITRSNIGLHLEMGYGAKMPADHFRNADYTVSGYYGRAGLQYHYAYDPGSNFFIGANYGYSMYEDEAIYSIESTLWDPHQGSFARKELTGQWVEVVAGSESVFWRSFYLGFQIRFRALIRHDNFSPFEVFAIPGYGRTIDKTLPALNLYLKFMIPFDR